jgi:hypothetical protein
MDFNFYEEYKSYSNVELLKILKQPANYQPAAVEAATLILQEREVSEEDNFEVNQHFEQITQHQQVKKEKSAFFRQTIIDFLEPVIKPGTEVKPEKWLNILLVLIGIEYAWGAYNAILGAFFGGGNSLTAYGHGYDIFFLLDIFYLLYVPFIFYLLFKRKRWGWILLFADNMLSAMVGLLEVYSMVSRFNNYGSGDIPVTFFIGLIIKCLVLFFLWRKDISTLFKVSVKTKQHTVAFTAVIGFLLFAVLYILLDM